MRPDGGRRLRCIQVVWPVQPNGYFHAEQGQEDWLALRHRAGVAAEATKPAEAYASLPQTTTGPYRGGLPGDA